jgi:hypothetical protein
VRPVSVREMDAHCYERGIEFDTADVPLELAETTQGIVAQPAWEGRSLAQELYERRAAERRGGARCSPGSRRRMSSGSRGSERRYQRPNRDSGVPAVERRPASLASGTTRASRLAGLGGASGSAVRRAMRSRSAWAGGLAVLGGYCCP